ncbi:MAG: BtrH N-terminal domain-containing protein [Acidobacteriota bacterium]
MSAMSNIVRHHGIRFADPLIYGLGEGYFFWYVDIAPDEAPPVLIGKNVFMEHRFCENVGATLTIHEPITADEVEDSYRRMARGESTVIKCDPFFFKYIEWMDDEPLHFGEHVLIVVHIEGDTAYLADVFSDDIVGVPLDELRQARASTDTIPFMQPRNRWYEFDFPESVDDLEGRVATSITRTLEHMFDGQGGFGLNGLARMRDAYTSRLRECWDKDRKQFAEACFAGGCRILEGHCGAFNRGMLGRYLTVAAHMLQLPKLSNPVLEAQAIDAWKALGDMLIACAENAEHQDVDPQQYDDINSALDTAIEREKQLCQSIEHASKPFLSR